MNLFIFFVCNPQIVFQYYHSDSFKFISYLRDCLSIPGCEVLTSGTDEKFHLLAWLANKRVHWWKTNSSGFFYSFLLRMFRSLWHCSEKPKTVFYVVPLRFFVLRGPDPAEDEPVLSILLARLRFWSLGALLRLIWLVILRLLWFPLLSTAWVDPLFVVNGWAHCVDACKWNCRRGPEPMVSSKACISWSQHIHLVHWKRCPYIGGSNALAKVKQSL